MNCKHPLCGDEKADGLVKLICETRNNVGRNGKVELLTDILLCRQHFLGMTVASIGNQMKDFGEEALRQQGFRRPYYHRLQFVVLDSEEARAHFAGKPN